MVPLFWVALIVAGEQVHHAAHFVSDGDLQDGIVYAAGAGGDAVIDEPAERVPIERVDHAALVGDRPLLAQAVVSEADHVRAADRVGVGDGGEQIVAGDAA